MRHWLGRIIADRGSWTNTPGRVAYSTAAAAAAAAVARGVLRSTPSRNSTPSVAIAVRVTPNAKATRVLGLTPTTPPQLRVAVAAAAAKGAANAATVALIANLMDRPVRSAYLDSGLTSRDKVVVVDGITPEAAVDSLTPVLCSTT